MRPALLAPSLLCLALGSCSNASTDAASPSADATVHNGARPVPAATNYDPADTTVDPSHQPDGGVAFFAGGCFWGVEHYMEQLDGVKKVESGYMGGKNDNPTYEQVSYEKTGHLETVRVEFDPGVIPYREVAKRFFEIHDPTQRDGQGPDIGEQYLSAVFYTGPGQKADTESLIGELQARGYQVVTQVRPAKKWFTAEGYHQDYYARKGSKPYCHARVKRFDKDAK